MSDYLVGQHHILGDGRIVVTQRGEFCEGCVFNKLQEPNVASCQSSKYDMGSMDGMYCYSIGLILVEVTYE